MKKYRYLLGLLVVIGSVALIFIVNSMGENVDESQATEISIAPQAEVEAEVAAVATPAVEEPVLAEVADAPEVVVEPVVEAELGPEDALEPINYYNGMDPESQPRSFHRFSFAGLESYPEGYTLTGDDLRLSDLGWTLAPPSPGEEDLPRSAMVESPVMKLDFPSNALSPLWMENSPAGTEVLVELAASPDGVNWTAWYPTTGEHVDGETAQFNEITGEPNPNYGFTIGDMVFFGLGKYKYYKYNLMLYSESADSPVLSDFALYQQDSTMGDGYEAEYVAAADTRGEEER